MGKGQTGQRQEEMSESKDDWQARHNAKCFRNNFRNDMKPKEEPKAKPKPWTEKVTDFSPRMGK